MSHAQLTKTINWFALAIALALLVLVGLHIYKKHFLAVAGSNDYLFSDLPTQAAAPLEADIQKVVQAHIMGEIPKVTSAPKAVVEKPKPAAPKTKLNIRLTGVIDGATPESGFAMIEIKPGKTAVLAVGEAIGDTGAILHQVLPGEVLVDRNGQIESVKMKRKSLELSQQLPNSSLINLMDESVEMASTNEAVYYSKEEPDSYDATANDASLAQSTELSEKQVQQRLRVKRLKASREAAKLAQANTAASSSQNSAKTLGKLSIPKKLQRL
ncbi:MAG: type II secretory pathway component PulC [Saprospiraceae bacterium]|jgi:type II secretory pathway component PulC